MLYLPLCCRPRKPYAPGALANITLPHVLGLYGLKSGDEVYDRAVTAFKEGEYGLNFQNLTYNRWGLVYYPLENYRPNRPDVLLNAWGIWVIDQITDPSEVNILHSIEDHSCIQLKHYLETYNGSSTLVTN